MTASERFHAKVSAAADGCYLWTGARSAKGYGRFANGRGRVMFAHRWIWEQFNGPVPEGSDVHHVCGQKACVRLEHLIVVTKSEHARAHDKRPTPEAAAKAVEHYRSLTHCKRGHPFSGDNLYVDPRGQRHCRTCNRERTRQYRERMSGNLA